MTFSLARKKKRIEYHTEFSSFVFLIINKFHDAFFCRFSFLFFIIFKFKLFETN